MFIRTWYTNTKSVVNYLFNNMYQPINTPVILLPACTIEQSKYFTHILLVIRQHAALNSLSMVAPVCPTGTGMTVGVVQPENNLAQVCVIEKADGFKGQHLHPPLGCCSAQLCSCGPHTIPQSRHAPTHAHFTQQQLPRWHSSWLMPIFFRPTDLCCWIQPCQHSQN